MPLPYNLTNAGNPVVDATQLMGNFNYLYALFTGSAGNEQSGTYALVACDGTGAGVSISYPNQFPNTIGSVTCTAANYSGVDNAGVYCTIVGNPTRSGFTVKCFNGAPGTTVTVNWRASGT